MEREIKNAKITGITISMADYNCLTFRITVQGACWGCSIGNYKIGTGMLGADYWDASGSGVVAMMKIMDTVGSDTWEGLNGLYCRVEFTEDGTMIQKIGNLINDKWFDVREFFKKASETTPAVYILDERSEKNDDDDDDDNTDTDFDSPTLTDDELDHTYYSDDYFR